MTNALQYASPTTRAVRPLWQRVVVVPVCYLGWTIGWAIACGFLMAPAVQQRLPAVGVTAAMIAGGVVGAFGGATLAHLARRKRWPHVTVAALSALAMLYLAYALYDMLRGPPTFLTGFFVQLGLILLGGAFAMLCGGVAGILLARRPRA